MSEQLKQTYTARKINKHRLDAIMKYAGDSVLDFGCGNGSYVLELRNAKKITGADYQEFDTWNEARELFTVASADDLPSFANNSVDTVCSFEVLEHMKDPEKVLREFKRITRNNIIITVPNCSITKGMKSSSFIYYHWIDPTHIQFFTKATLEEVVKKAGFEIIYSGFINQVNLLPVIKENFGWEKKTDKSFKIKILNWAMKKYTRKEYFITLMLVAKKIDS